MNPERGHEGRKVRAPQGRVVRNPDCSRLEKVATPTPETGIRKVPQKRDRLLRFAGRDELINSELQGICLGG